MVTTYTWDLFKDPFFIGFNSMVDRLNSVHNTASHQSYPPYNIVKIDDETFRVDLALAGFDKKDVDVTVDNGTLVIKGEVPADDSVESIHKGIAARKFTRTFALGEYMEVTGAELKNGLLSVTVERIVPEDKKPKTIKVK
ncbi:MAG: Hsp20 family protein [Candidatus Nanopelagicaceae bacterium]